MRVYSAILFIILVAVAGVILYVLIKKAREISRGNKSPGISEKENRQQ